MNEATFVFLRGRAVRPSPDEDDPVNALRDELHALADLGRTPPKPPVPEKRR